jgi:hypothetical protein
MSSTPNSHKPSIKYMVSSILQLPIAHCLLPRAWSLVPYAFIRPLYIPSVSFAIPAPIR